MSNLRNLLVSDKVVISRLGISRRTLYRYLQDGTVDPPPGKLGKNRRGWTEGDLIMAEQQLREKHAQEPAA